MASAGADWRTNPFTQLRWMFGYLRSVYGSPANAYRMWSSRSPHWYREGGAVSEPVAGMGMQSGQPYMFGETGNEYVSSQADMKDVARLLGAVLRELRAINGHTRTGPERTGRAVGATLNGSSRSVALGRG
jgi:hypothetical protein